MRNVYVNVGRRLGQLRERYGVGGTVWRILSKPVRLVWHRLRLLVYQRTYVFRFEGDRTFSPPAHLADMRVLAYDTVSDITDELREKMDETFGERAVAGDLRELAAGARLWLAALDGEIVAIWHTKLGRHLRPWHIPIAEDDVVMFRARTAEPYRGRSISPTMMRWIIAHAIEPEQQVFVDCSIYNRPSRRGIEKAGFRMAAKVKPRWERRGRSWALDVLKGGRVWRGGSRTDEHRRRRNRAE